MVKKKSVKRIVKKSVDNQSSRNPWFRSFRKAVKGSWGFIPINCKGWAALSILIIINVFAALYFNLNVLDGKNWAKFGLVFLLSILVFILIAKRKTRGVKDDL